MCHICWQCVVSRVPSARSTGGWRLVALLYAHCREKSSTICCAIAFSQTRNRERDATIVSLQRRSPTRARSEKGWRAFHPRHALQLIRWFHHWPSPFGRRVKARSAHAVCNGCWLFLCCSCGCGCCSVGVQLISGSQYSVSSRARLRRAGGQRAAWND